LKGRRGSCKEFLKAITCEIYPADVLLSGEALNNLGRIRKILVVRNDNIGDVVCTTPCFEALRESFPEAFIAVLVCRLTEEVVAGNPFLDKIYVYDKAKHGRYKSVFTAWWKQFKVLLDIRSEHFDLAIGIRSEFSPSLGWLVYASGAPHRLGLKPPKKDKKFSFFYNIYAEPLKQPSHEVERSLHVLRKIGVDIEKKRLFLRLMAENRKQALDFFSKHHIQRKKPVVCVNFSRRLEEGRYWSYENYVALIKRFLSEDIQTIASCDPGEARIVEGFLKVSDHTVPLYWSRSLKNFAALIEECSVFVTIDGGPMHIAAAVGTPVVGLFGKIDPRVWAPWGEGHTVLRKGNDHNLISVDDVFGASIKMLRDRAALKVLEHRSGSGPAGMTKNGPFTR